MPEPGGAQWTRLRNEPARAVGAVEQLLRYESPVQLTDRVALGDVVVDGIASNKANVSLPRSGPLARMAGQLALSVPLARFRRIELDGLMMRAPTPMFRNIRRLAVRCEANDGVA